MAEVHDCFTPAELITMEELVAGIDDPGEAPTRVVELVEEPDGVTPGRTLR